MLACLDVAAGVLAAALALAPGLACTTMGAAGDSVALRVETNVPDAIVWVDDRLVGTAASLTSSGTRLRVGFHRIEVRHPSHYSFFTEVDPKRGEDVVIRAQLHELVQ
ncbi:MAG TPA: PEGA domain-containing protein [Polyangia bacterium]